MEGLVPKGLRCDSSILWLAFFRTHSVSRGAHISHQELRASCIIEVQIIPFCRKYFHWLYIALLSRVEKYSLVWQGRPRKTWWNPLLVLILIPLLPTPPSLLYLYWSSFPLFNCPKCLLFQLSSYLSQLSSTLYCFSFQSLTCLTPTPILRLS